MASTAGPFPDSAGSPPERDRRWERCCLWGLGLLLLLGAWWSVGFHQYDEHFQILEFAGRVLGITPASALPWEYGMRIRSWFQPALVVFVVHLLHPLGLVNPFHIAVVLRLLSAALYLVALVRLLEASHPWFRSTRAWKATVLASCFFWFVPYLAVRFSSEGWSGSLFFLGFAALIRDAEGHPASRLRLGLAGVLLGLAFAVRYQSGILIAAGVGWFALVGRARWSRLAPVAAGVALAIVAGLMLDRWGYGAWTFTPWRYLRANLVTGVAAARFGSAPWWWYGPRLVLDAGPPIGVLLLLGVLTTWFRRPRNPLVWVSVAFVGAHVVLAHKELRFLFPLVLAVPILMGLALDQLPGLAAWATERRVGRALLVTLVGLDAVGLGLRLAIPARPEIALQQRVYRVAARRLLVVRGEDPYRLGGLSSYFYRPPGLEIVNLLEVDGRPEPSQLAAGGLVALLDTTRVDLSGLRCGVIYRAVPAWMERPRIWSLLHPVELRPWTLERCAPMAGAQRSLTAPAPEARTSRAGPAGGAGGVP
ncbi:MAG TPA: hypothetical protein VNH46_02180, partial [Gemmatimonadales bacterium]|nr:hypothetical protein [Gemmatimonadales bacterium]